MHALTAAAMTHSIARACAEGRMTKCSCGPKKHNREAQDFQWGGCNDNLKHGKRVTRSFLDLRGGDGDEVSEILRHDSEVRAIWDLSLVIIFRKIYLYILLISLSESYYFHI